MDSRERRRTDGRDRQKEKRERRREQEKKRYRVVKGWPRRGGRIS